MTTETRYTIGTIWDEKDTAQFRAWLTAILNKDTVTVVFTKADGTERAMRCTLDPKLLPAVEVKSMTEVTESKQRKGNSDVRTVYDVEAKAWRSFRWTSIKSVTFDTK